MTANLAYFDNRLLTYKLVLLDGTTTTVDAADDTDILVALIPGYGLLQDVLISACRNGERPAEAAAHRDLFEARHAHAQTTRVSLQRRIAADARRNGTWQALSAAERAELRRAATGAIPAGIPRDGVSESGQEPGQWTTDAVRLVLNRADYGLLASVGNDDWRDEPAGLPDDSNIVFLDPADDNTYVDSLEAAGIVTYTGGVT